MQKKIKKELVLCLILMMVILCAGCAKTNSKKTTGVLEDDPEYLYDKTVAEVKKINENSYFFGHNLLDVPPEESSASLNNPLNVVGDDFYNIDSYHGSGKIVVMELVSEDANLLGISPGDDTKAIEDKLNDTAFEQIESRFESTIRYQAYHIYLYFEVTDDEKIDKIIISVNDPTEEKPIY